MIQKSIETKNELGLTTLT